MAVRGSGELKIEFYAHLGEIKDLYFNQGVVVFTILHKRLVEKYRLSLDYQAFCYYARRELKGDKPCLSPLSDRPAVSNNDQSATDCSLGKDQSSLSFEDSTPKKEGEPVVVRPCFPRVGRFNPHVREVDEGDILK